MSPCKLIFLLILSHPVVWSGFSGLSLSSSFLSPGFSGESKTIATTNEKTIARTIRAWEIFPLKKSGLPISYKDSINQLQFASHNTLEVGRNFKAEADDHLSFGNPNFWKQHLHGEQNKGKKVHCSQMSLKKSKRICQKYKVNESIFIFSYLYFLKKMKITYFWRENVV